MIIWCADQKSPDELVRRKGHGFLLIVIAVVSPTKFHLALFDVDEPMGYYPRSTFVHVDTGRART
jgi:hypothetical protein